MFTLPVWTSYSIVFGAWRTKDQVNMTSLPLVTLMLVDSKLIVVLMLLQMSGIVSELKTWFMVLPYVVALNMY